MTTQTQILEACIRSRLVQAWELSSHELNKIESICHNFLMKMIAHSLERKNVPLEYLKQKQSNTKK